MVDPEYQYLYLLIRNDLDSMNNGKAIAHGAHAAIQFSFESRTDPAGLPVGYTEWENATPGGFGTKISLSVSLHELQEVVTVARLRGFRAGITVDPTYPYVLHREYAGLVQHPAAHPPKPLGNGMMLCLREETTAGYVFGDKRDLQTIVGRFPLVP